MSSARPNPASGSSQRPTGTITFAFTDIEGSTKRWERDRTAMQSALRRHDAIVRDAIGGRGGHVFKTVGDAFCAAFDRPEAAVAAMLDVQRALAAEDFSAVDGVRVRAAIHVGTADERDGDYFGPAVNRVARLLATGHGGQILISGAAAEVLKATLAQPDGLRDLGLHHLKDLERPEHVYQLLAPGLREEFPALSSQSVARNNLPPALSSFVGREAELADIARLLDANRIVTLAGAGGVGKTRTAIHVAAQLLDGYGDGVWYVELAPLTGGEYIPTTIARAIGMELPPGGDPIGHIVRFLKERRLLLVVDNCEHLVDDAGRLVSELVRHCPHVRVLATSRQALGIAGEITYRMPSLSLPSASEAIGAVDASNYAALLLFDQRARAVDPAFTLTDETAPVVADICRRLDGIPLAIELAAARITLLRPFQLRDRLDERFRILTGGKRDALPRHQTLLALIDWSHNLLDERERIVFRRLGIFANGFTLEAAAAVAGGDGIDELDAFDALSSLVDKSLVACEGTADARRYRLLESTRRYAAEKLAAAGEQSACAGKRLRYLIELFAYHRRRFEQDAREDVRVDLLAQELEDVRAAIDDAPGRGDNRGAAELLSEIGRAWRVIGLDREGMQRTERVLDAPIGDPALEARLLIALSSFGVNLFKHVDALSIARRALRCARSSGDETVVAKALATGITAAASLRQFDEASALAHEARTLASLPLEPALGLLWSQAYLDRSRGDYDAARASMEELCAAYRAAGNHDLEQGATLNLADTYFRLGKAQLAIDLTRGVVEALRIGKDRTRLALAANNLAEFSLAVGDFDGAAAAAREAIALFAKSDPATPTVALGIEFLARAIAVRGDLSRAAVLEGYAAATIDAAGHRQNDDHEALVALLRDAFPAEQLAGLFAQGAALTPEAAIALALAHDVA